MNLKLEKRTIILIFILIFLLIISLLTFFIADNHLVGRILFFPEKDSVTGEMRRVPRQSSVENDIELLVNEMILGPYSIDHLRIIPETTKLQNLLLRDKSLLYIDFSADLIVAENDLSVAPVEMIELIKRNLIYNFPVLEKIIISVDGQPL